LILKQPTGWFAAGREVSEALALLSDGAFKLYIYLCLAADRHTGRAVMAPVEWARTLRKDLVSIERHFGELQVHGICDRQTDHVEICDRFWPYQKRLVAAPAPHTQAEFLRQVRTAFLAPACVRSAFTAADEKLAVNLSRRGTTLEQLCRAIWLGCARKYMAMLNGQTRLPITSLAYFASLIDEVNRPDIPIGYWEHVRRKMQEMEKRWLQTVNLAPNTDVDTADPAPAETR
jgi:hypothetical protein